MVRGVAAHRGVRMPGFFSYMTLSAALLLPVFAVLTALFFH
jgi:Putative citrate transport